MRTRTLPRPLAAMIAGIALLALQAIASVPVRAEAWERHATPEQAGFSSAQLAAAESVWLGLDSAPASALFVVFRGKVLVEWGDATAGYWCHSMRKSFLSALYGIHVQKGHIDPDATMADLGIDDEPPLTAAEKQARVRHLLKARSGVYHEAACETQGMRDARPARGSHPPDTFWYYNNWDFNVLGTIFRQETGRDVFRDFNKKIGRPIGMEDFEPGECEYPLQPEYSIHTCYSFRMSARDRARVGQLFLQNGRWDRRQIVPESWVEESTSPWSATGTPGEGYGYMWWTYAPRFFRLVFRDASLHHLRAYAAAGYGGQLIFVVPDADMVLVTAVDVRAGGDLSGTEALPILEAILTARPVVDLRLFRSKATPLSAVPGERLRLTTKVRNRSGVPSLATTADYYLAPLARPDDDPVRLGAVDVPEIEAGRMATLRLNLRLPQILPAGDYRLVTLLDGDKENYDLRRQNNARVTKGRIEIR